jgi:hypothetical protein
MNVKLLAVVTVAALWRLAQEFRILRKSLRSAKTMEVPEDVMLRRKAHCQTCRIFFKPLQSCDSPLRYEAWPAGKPEGCLCHIPTKSRLKCNCPLYDQSGGLEGWPEELNSFPHES